MVLARFLIVSLEFVFGLLLRLLSFWLRPPLTNPEDGQDSVEPVLEGSNIRASASATSSDALLPCRPDPPRPDPDPAGYTDSPSSDAGFLSPGSTPELQYPVTTPPSLRHARNGRTCNIFSPPSTRRHYPARGHGVDVSHSSSNDLQTPDMSLVATQVPPPLIFAFDDEEDNESAVDLETGLGVRLGNATSRNSSIFLGSSASIFSKLNVEGLLSPSRPATSESATTSPGVARLSSPSRAQPTLPLFTQDLGGSNRGSPNFGVEAASYAATYSGSPDADIRLEAFYLYEFTPYTPPTVDSPLTQERVKSSQLLRPQDGAYTPAYQVHATDDGDTPCGPRHLTNSRLRPLCLPKELAARQVAQTSSARERFTPRPLMLPQQIARRSVNVTTLLGDIDARMLADSTATDIASVPLAHGKAGATTNLFGSHVGTSSDMIFWDAVEASAVILPCYASSPALSNIVRDYQDAEAGV